jgi:hypothetical protein
MTGKGRIVRPQQGAFFATIPEMTKDQLGPATHVIDRLRTYSDPRQLAGNSVTLRLLPYSPDAYHGIELPVTNSSHAIVIAKHPRLRIGIAAVGPLVDQCSHLLPDTPLNGDL